MTPSNDEGLCWQPSGTADVLPYYFNFVSSILSIIGSICIIVSFACRKRKKGTQTLSTLVFCLAISDLIASSGICASQSVMLFADFYDSFLCVFLRAVLQFGYLASFMWTSCISVLLYRATMQASNEGMARMVAMNLVSWGIPGILVGVLIALKGIAYEAKSQWCSSPPVLEWLFWFTPLLLSLCFNLVMYSLILHKFRRNRQLLVQAQPKPKVGNLIWTRITLYILVFIICWVWDVVDHVLSYVYPDCHVYILWTLQTIFSPLQGFLNFLVYGYSSNLLSCCRPKSNKFGSMYSPIAVEREHEGYRLLSKAQSL
eukprot:TRINITY_DN894_c0_g1_i1.p2 TRINITY_DN894_c0_g1~~TRINITY_DN894_c0_g1_i1.p2  ORF type:complete len:315 (+),score=57.06 TRINITY_DN894_c0_g1_i1:124-1068(+)